MKCKNCGKLFDYEKYYGICPKCGTFQKPENPQQEPETEERVDLGFDAAGTDRDIYTYVEDGNAAAGGTKAKIQTGSHKGSVIYVVCCIALLFLSGLLNGLCTIVQEKQLAKEAALSDLSIVEVPAGEPAQIGTRTVTVLGAKVLEKVDVRPEFPAGQMCVAVHLRIRNSEEYPTYETSLDAPYLAYTDTDGEEIFKEAVSSYDFSSYEIYYGLRLLESYDFGYESDVEGDVIFFAEPGFSKPRICLEDRYRPDNRMQMLKAVYELPVELSEEVEE